VGRALSFDLDTYVASRQDALVILRTLYAIPITASSSTPGDLPRGADGQEKTVNLLRALGSLVEDCCWWWQARRDWYAILTWALNWNGWARSERGLDRQRGRR